MKLGIETLFQMLTLCVMIFCLVGMICINQYILGGRRTLYNAIDRIEISDNRSKTLKRCIRDAKKQGYLLTASPLGDSHEESWLLTLSYEIGYKDKCLFEGAVQGYVL